MRKMNKLVLTGIIMAAMALSTACGAAASSTSTTTAAAAGSTATAIKTMAGADLQAIEDDKDKKETVLVVDVRSPEEYKAGHVTYAINVPIDTFKENYTKLEAWKNKRPISFGYFRSGFPSPHFGIPPKPWHTRSAPADN